MRMLRNAIRLYPAQRPPSAEIARVLEEIELREPEDDPFDALEPPTKNRAHWEAVWRAVANARFHEPDREESWEDEKREMTALAKKLPRLPVPLERDGRGLIALLPPPAQFGTAWAAVYLHPNHRELALEATRNLRNEWNHPGIHVERVDVPATTTPAIYHVAAKALVPVERIPFLEIHPHFWLETCWDDENGDMRQWHEAEDFANAPTTPEPYILAQRFSDDTKIGGYPVLNADDNDPPLWGDGHPMGYAFHLSASFFDVEFGDAGSLHVWLSPSTNEFAGVMDCA
jgi:hypothetical protein